MTLCSKRIIKNDCTTIRFVNLNIKNTSDKHPVNLSILKYLSDDIKNIRVQLLSTMELAAGQSFPHYPDPDSSAELEPGASLYYEASEDSVDHISVIVDKIYESDDNGNLVELKEPASDLEEINKALRQIVDCFSDVIEGHGAMNALMLLENRNEICRWIIPVCNKEHVYPIQINGDIKTLVKILNQEFKEGDNIDSIKYIIFRRPNYKYHHVLKLEKFLEAIDMLNKEYREKMIGIPAADIYIADYL